MLCTRRLLSSIIALTLATSTLTAHASEPWPTQPIKLIVPYAAGGPTDTLARLLATKMGATLGQAVIVENKIGAGGSIGVAATLQAPANGNTFALVAPGPLVGMPNLMKTAYGLDNIQFLTLVAKIPSVLVVNTNSGIDSLDALLKKAKQEPGKLTYSSAGPGTTPHIGMEIFEDQAGVSLLHIPYKGAAPALTAVVGGEVQVTMVDLLPILPFVKGGQVKPLAIAASNRAPQLPDVPTMAEKGLPSVSMETTYGLIAPKGLPAPIAAKLRDAAISTVQSQEFKQLMQQQGAQPVTSSSNEYQTLMRAESNKWKNIINKAKITLD
jgi:tripartite-type tricarboxylate transporter receptor subunit TctC